MAGSADDPACAAIDADRLSSRGPGCRPPAAGLLARSMAPGKEYRATLVTARQRAGDGHPIAGEFTVRVMAGSRTP